MSTNQHTPGPWHVTSGNDLTTGEVSADPMGVRTICTTWRPYNAKADAHLIAAAPALLHAAELALTALELPSRSRASAVQALRAAITVAIGDMSPPNTTTRG